MMLRISKIQQWMLLPVVFLAPAYLLRFRLGSLPTNALEVCIVVLCAIWFLGHIYNSTRPQVPPWWKPAALIVIGGLVSTLAAPPELWLKSLGILKGFIVEPMLVGWIAYDVLHRANRPEPIAKRMFLAIILSAAAIAIVALTAYLGFGRDAFITWDGRLKGIFLSPNHLAMTLGPAAVLAAGFALFLHNKKMRLLAVSVLVPIIPALWLTQSFGGILSVVIAFVFLGFLFYSKLPPTNYHLRRLILASAFIVITVVAAFAIKNITQDLADSRSSFASRVTVWRVSGEILKDYWLFGIGPGNFQEYYLAQQKNFPPYFEWAVPEPHNLFLAFWLQTGLLGLIGFFWLLFLLFRKALHPIPYTLYPVLLALAAILLHGLVDTSYWKNDLALVFYVLLSLCAFSAAKPNKLNPES